MNRKRSARARLGQLFLVAPNTLPFLAILAYFSGWWYRNEYFSEFGIPRSSFTVADYTVFIHSFSVMRRFVRVVTDSHIRPYIALYTIPLAIYLVLLFVVPRITPFIDPIVTRARSRLTTLLRQIIPCLEHRHYASVTSYSADHSATSPGPNVLLKLGAWILVFHILFVVSTAAGRQDAAAVLQNPRTVWILFDTESAANSDQPSSLEIATIHHIERKAARGNIALIWRTSHETVLMELDNKVLRRVFRLDNEYIMGVVYEVSYQS